jgi:hypothetical protein
MSNITIDGHEFDLTKVPQVEMLAGRAIAHILRNEAASTVRGKLVYDAREAKRKTTNDPKADLSDDEKKAIKFDSENATHAALYADAQAAKAALIREGKVGEGGERGPRKTEFERRVEAMCKKAVVASIQAKLKLWVGQKGMPKLDQVFKYKDAKGAPVERTFENMVDGYYKTNKVAVDKAVQKALDDEARAAERATKDEGESINF